jgi:hypothetical protein
MPQQGLDRCLWMFQRLLAASGSSGLPRAAPVIKTIVFEDIFDLVSVKGMAVLWFRQRNGALQEQFILPTRRIFPPSRLRVH